MRIVRPSFLEQNKYCLFENWKHFLCHRLPLNEHLSIRLFLSTYSSPLPEKRLLPLGQHLIINFHLWLLLQLAYELPREKICIYRWKRTPKHFLKSCRSPMGNPIYPPECAVREFCNFRILHERFCLRPMLLHCSFELFQLIAERSHLDSMRELDIATRGLHRSRFPTDAPNRHRATTYLLSRILKSIQKSDSQCNFESVSIGQGTYECRNCYCALPSQRHATNNNQNANRVSKSKLQ